MTWIFLSNREEVRITISAEDRDAAEAALKARISQLEEMGVEVPAAWQFDLRSAF